MADELRGLRALVTAGPTYEPIDPVRFIGNRSSGKQGCLIAASLAARGAQVLLVIGPTSCADPAGVEVRHVETAVEMFEACRAALPVDVAICAAAVADWRVAASPRKLKKAPGAAPPVLALVENPDILRWLGRETGARPRLVVGFAAETENVLENAYRKRARKGCDWILANDVSLDGRVPGVFGGDRNRVWLAKDDGAPARAWPPTTKADIAERLAEETAAFFAARNASA